MKSTSTTPGATAHHEAAHAVAAFHLRRSFHRITVEPDAESLGHILYRRFGDWFRPDCYTIDARHREMIDTCTQTALAGPVGEAMYLGRETLDGQTGGGDFTEAVDMAMYLCGSVDEAEAYIDWLVIRTRNMLTNRVTWAEVEGLAAALLEKRRLSYRAARSVIHEAGNNFIKSHSPSCGAAGTAQQADQAQSA